MLWHCLSEAVRQFFCSSTYIAVNANNKVQMQCSFAKILMRELFLDCETV